MKSHRIALAGFGNVGRAIAELIAANDPAAAGLELAAVSDVRFGTLVSSGAIDPASLMSKADRDGTFEGLDGFIGGGISEMISATDASTLVELTFTDLVTGEPATGFIRTALAAGMNVSTTNKGPVSLHLDSLESLAAENGVALAYEGTVMSGTPTVLVAEQSIRGAGFAGAMGILNGTTNYIITQMESGTPYTAALEQAQANGYAEADPSGDVDGKDVAAKLSILARVLLGIVIHPDDVAKTSLSTLSADTITQAVAGGKRWKYIASLTQVDGRWKASVGPQILDGSHPLAGVSGATNAITFSTDLLGDVTLIGPGAGRPETAYSVISDLNQIRRSDSA